MRGFIAGRPVDSVHPGRLERMKGLGTAEMFHTLLIAETSIRQVYRSSAKHGGFAQQARQAAAPLQEPLP